VPEVVAADTTGVDIGEGVPALLMSFLPGRAVPAPDAGRLAEVAATIHAADPAGFGHAYFGWYTDTTVAPPPASPPTRTCRRYRGHDSANCGKFGCGAASSGVVRQVRVWCGKFGCGAAS
jgi:hypothetical protein